MTKEKIGQTARRLKFNALYAEAHRPQKSTDQYGMMNKNCWTHQFGRLAEVMDKNGHDTTRQSGSAKRT